MCLVFNLPQGGAALRSLPTGALSLNKSGCLAILPPVKKLLPYSFTALLALLAGLCALSLSGMNPFGEATLCWQDNGQQVASDFGYVRGVWEGRHALDWSFACGGSPRSSFHPTFNNLVSPLTWGVAAMPGISALTGLSLLFLLQLTLLPLGALFYLRTRFSRLPLALSMALALAYAFGGFVLTKYTFLPFLNVALLFPWYVAALEALLRRGTWLPYCLMLAFMLAVGTYFAWMWLLFTAVYATACTGWRWRSPVRQHTLTLFLASAGALLLASFSWLPSLLVTAASARAGEAHFWWNATRVEGEPTCLVHLLSLPAALLGLAWLFAWRRLHISRYAITLAVVIVGLASVSASTLWHLSCPWDFAGRFGYMADFMLIGLAAQLAQHFRYRAHLLPGLILLPLMALCGALLLGTVLTDTTLETTARYQSSADRVNIAEWATTQVEHPAGRAKSYGYAAVENLSFFTPFDSLSHFTACITQSQEETLARWGYQQRAAVISTEGGTLATDTLLGIRYILSQEGEGAPYRLEENPYHFGMGIMLPPDVFPLQGHDPLACQQNMLTRLLGKEQAGTRCIGRVGEPLHLPPGCLSYLQQPAEGEHIIVDGWPYARWGGVGIPPRLWFIPPAYRWAGGLIGKGTEFELYHLPLTSLEALQHYGQQLPVQVRYAGHRMSICCRSTMERSLLFLPLLWQKGYEARINTAAAPVLNLDGFVGIALPEPGEHQVELAYHAPGTAVGSLLSASALPLLAAAWFGTRRRSPLATPGALNTLCRRVLLLVSLILLFWPLLTLPLGLLWR